MVRIIGILKFLVSFAGFIFLIMVFFNLKMNNIEEKLAAMAIISAICGIYLYYLILTGIWNLNSKSYKTNIVLFLGILLHFAYISALIFFGYTSFPRAVFLTGLFTSAFGVAIGIYDLNQLISGWKNRKQILR